MRNAASCLATATSNDPRARHWRALALGFLASFLLAPGITRAEQALLLPEATLTPEEAEPEEGFGRAFAIDGDVAVVTANIGSFFMGTEPEDNGGAAYVFERNSSGIWHQTARLDPPYEGLFGHAVAVEGRTVVVGAPFAAAAFVFEDLGAGWVHTGTLTGNGDLGFSVAIDGGVIAVSTLYPNGMRLFRKGTNGWAPIADLPGGGNYGGSDYRGPRVDIDGNRAIHHSPGDNFTEPEQPELVYIHTKPEGGDWSAATTTIIGPASINRHVAISGNVAVSGGVIREYTPSNGWQIVGNSIASDVEGTVDGDLVLSSASIRQRNASGEWPEAAMLMQSSGRSLYGSRLSGRRAIGMGSDAVAYVHDIPVDLERAPVQQDDFQDGNAAGWVATGGSFAVVATTASSVYRQSSLTGNAAALLGETIGSNQSIQADIRPSAFSGADRWFGLVARYADANNYYYVTARTTNVVQLKKLVNGVVQTLGSVPLTVQANRHYRLRLETIDQRVRLLIDNRLVLDVRDTSLLEGQVGVMMYKAAADYDNLVWHENPQRVQLDQDFELSATPSPDLVYPMPLPQGWAYTTVGGSRVIAQSQTIGGSLVHSSSTGGANQSVSVDARATAFNGADRWFGVALRYKDDQNYYYLTVRNSNTVSLRKLVNGAIHTFDTASFTVAANTWYHLRLENVGSTLRGYINDQLVVEATDSTPIPQSSLDGSALVLYKTAVQYDNWLIAQP